ncbi:MAG: hypothetical protein DME25_07205 [Verrucomicrobia bacterium]|nr:MAG: hypothetical protein DME25_07205 [Verrucomicrobiota bacterium]
MVLALWLYGFCGGASAAQAPLQFDVFLGYDGVVPEASWFPIVCEIKNDGPSFTGTIELTSENQGQTRRLMVELPTGTLKRVVLPAFSTARAFSAYGGWEIRLLDERGKIRAEQLNVRPRKLLAANAKLIGALARTAGGAPTLRPILAQQSDLQPTSVRLQTQIFPDNPLVLEGMNCLYLNSEKAAELKTREPNQVEAIYAWLYAGGHLIIAVEQASDITGTAWLRNLFPCDLADMQGVKRHPELQQWLRTGWNTSLPSGMAYAPPTRYRRGTAGVPQPESSPESPVAPLSDVTDDYKFETSELQVAVGKVREGRVVVASDETPLIVTAQRGRGRVTALLFSPEREPFRSWKNLPTFWAKLTEVPGALYSFPDFNQPMRPSSDGIFGAMIETRQVHKLPIEWLLVLLIVYLVVIGPLDQFWLKRIGRPMLTWITFPSYVVLFSFVIYFIGYKLRAGEAEWNELHLVDVLLNPAGSAAELRGRTYASVYAPSNQRYRLESEQHFATLRGEFVGMWSGGQSSEKATVMQNGDNFKAEIFVPVWTSQLFVSDWWQSAEVPLRATVVPQGGGWQVTLANRTEGKLTNAHIVLDDEVMALGDVPANESKTVTVSRAQGTPLREFVHTYGQQFHRAVGARQKAFGESGRVEDLPNSAMAASFISQMSRQENYGGDFIAPPGLDLSSVVEHGQAVVLAWGADYSPIQPIYKFSPRRTHRQTLWRVPVQVQ